MKRLLILVIIGILSISSYSQETTRVKELSNAEKFSDRSGTLMKKEYINIGSVKKCDIKVVYYTDLIGGQKTTAIRFEYTYVSSYTSDTKIAVLDADEIDGLIKSINIISETIFPTTPENYSEISFRSRSGFESGCYSSNGSWSTFMKLERYDSNSLVFMEKEDFAIFAELLQKAKSKMN